MKTGQFAEWDVQKFLQARPDHDDIFGILARNYQIVYVLAIHQDRALIQVTNRNQLWTPLACLEPFTEHETVL